MSIFYAVARLLTATPYILVNVLRVPLVSNTPNGFLLYNVAVINYSTYVLSKQPKGAPPTAKWQWVSAHNMRREFIYEIKIRMNCFFTAGGERALPAFFANEYQIFRFSAG